MKHLTVILLLFISYGAFWAMGPEIYRALYPDAKPAKSFSHQNAKPKTNKPNEKKN